ncbi:MAG: NAD-dependent epimerase/dehydratase family protein [Oligoflexia bacterium]|nr:NAD-dependent epimerase/dehydratase family protein [Oligoflexia bacterium]
MILVLGATGFLGKRVCRLLEKKGLPFTRTSLSLGTDLRDANATLALFEKVRPEYVLNCAAYVGGIQFGGKHPVELFQNNLKMTLSLLEAAHRTGVKRIVNPISNCAYPGQATFFQEDHFWDGPLHESVLVYGFVRKASWVGSWAYAKQYNLDVLNLILSNMYGPEDHFEEERSHALGALVMKFMKAHRERLPSVPVWGTGNPVREWLYVDDGAEAMIRGLSAPRTLDPVNVGVGQGVSIRDLALQIKEATGYTGEIIFDPSKPDGAPYKTVNGSRGEKLLGWKPGMSLRDGIQITIEWYRNHETH